MKYYKELIDIESVSIDLDVLKSTFRVLTYGMPDANRQDVEYAMHNITDQLDALSVRLRHRFDVLFDMVRKDDEDETKKPRTKAKKLA